MSSGSSPDQALISAPTQKALSPVAVRIAQRIPASRSIRLAASASSSIISGVSALSFSARSSVTIATAPSLCSRIWLAPTSDTGPPSELEAHRRIAEQRRIHGFQLRIDPQRERRLIQHVAPQVHAGRNLPHHESVFEQIEHAAFGDVADFLLPAPRDGAAERDVLDRVHQFLALAFLPDLELAVADLELRARGEKAGKDNVRGVGGDVDETAAAGSKVRLDPEFRDVYVAGAVDLQKRQQRNVKSAALKIGELIGRRDDRVGVCRAAKGEAEQRYAADRALLDYPGDFAVQAFLDQHARHVGGDAEAEVGGRASRQLLRGTPRDNFLRPPFRQFEGIVRAKYFAADCRIVSRLRGLHLFRIDHNVVYQCAGHVH